MEAMARGLPVAAFQVGRLPELLPEISRSALVAPTVSGRLIRSREAIRPKAHSERLCLSDLDLNENIEFAFPPSNLLSSTQRTSQVGCRRVCGHQISHFGTRSA
jgi:hypothetical protein